MKKIIFMIIVLLCFGSVSADENPFSDPEYRDIYNNLNSSYDLFIGACNKEERLAIIKYAEGDFKKLSVGNIDSNFANLKTESGKDFDFFCITYAISLHNAIVRAEEYVGKNTLHSLNLETLLETKKNLFVVGSKIQSREDLTIIDDCKLIDKDFKDVLNEYFGYLETVCVSITIILCMTDIYKLFVSKDLDNKKAFKNIKGRIIALVVILLLPLIVNIVISLLNNYVAVDAIKCLES